MPVVPRPDIRALGPSPSRPHSFFALLIALFVVIVVDWTYCPAVYAAEEAVAGAGDTGEAVDPADTNAIVFVPEYNIVDCEGITDKRKCRREREACLWINSEKRCAKREQPISDHPGL